MSTLNSSKSIIRQKLDNFLLSGHPAIKKVIKWIWITTAVILISIPLFVMSVNINLFGLFGGMPGLKQIENPENDLSSELISADGVSLGSYFRYNRSQVTYDELSPVLVECLVHSEDHRFYQHSGMDFWAYPRVIFGLVTFQNSGGGSTITQQLAKNLFTLNPELDGPLSKLGRYPNRLIQKTKEWIISSYLERNFTKAEIITLYLNTSEFSSNAYGIKVASETYFNKEPKDLNILESAVFVGMLQNPSLFNPKLHPNNALSKRNQVLFKLKKHNIIKSDAEYDSLLKTPITLNYQVPNQNQGLATYFRSVLRSDLMLWCEENGYDLWESGLKIYTTIDSRMQAYAEEAMMEHMGKLQKEFDAQWKQRGKNPWVDDNGQEIKNFIDKKIKRTDYYRYLVDKYGSDDDSVKIMLNLKKPMTIFTWKGERDTLFSSIDSMKYYNRFLQTGMMSMDPETGAIKAWVGGINHKYFKYDHVRQGTRQPGSTFKPFVYGTAIEAGWSPCQEMVDSSPTIEVPGGTWTVKNAEGDYGKGHKMNLRQAMSRSINTITAQVIDQVGPTNVVNFANRLGIKSKLDAVPSLCLGTSDVSLFEMVGSYCGFVNLGTAVEPYFITRIEDKNGNILASFVPKKVQALNQQTAYLMLYMLKGGVEEIGGTSGGLSYELRKDNDIGGKTGTTDNASDGWYMGVTHNLVSGVWVGGDERSIHFPSWNFGQGSKSARPIWEKYMLKVYNDPTTNYTKGRFKEPTTRLTQSLDCDQVTSDTTQVDVNEVPW